MQEIRKSGYLWITVFELSDPSGNVARMPQHSDPNSAPTTPGRPGPVYDRALRMLLERDLTSACLLLGLPPPRPPELPHVLPATFPASTFTADLLLRIAPQQLAHVEYIRAPTRDLIPRMLQYRGSIMRQYPGHRLSQHVIVLGKGNVTGHNAPDQGFNLDLRLVYLRDLDPGQLILRPGLAPLAALARGAPAERKTSLAAALAVIQGHGGGRTAELLESAALLATIRLDVPTIKRILKEAGMAIDNLVAELFSETAPAQALLQQGRAEGRSLGQAEGRAELLAAMISARFSDPGSEATATAENLSTWSDPVIAIKAIQAAATLAELAELATHSPPR